MENVYDSSPNNSILYYPLYSLAGNLLKNVNPFILFYSLSIITSLVLVITIIFFIKKIYKRNSTVFISALTVLFAGGLGFLTYPFHDSLDSSMTSFSFHSAIQRPHEGIAVSAYIFLLMSHYYYVNHQNQKKQKKWLFSLFFFLLITCLFYPYYLLSFILIGSSLFILTPTKIKKDKIICWFILILLGTAEVLLMQKNLASNASFSGVIKQKLSNPTISSLFFGYGLLLIPLFLNLFRCKKLNSLQKYLLTWAIASIVLSFLPLGFARFFLRSSLFPVILLMIDFLKETSQKISQESSEKLLLALLLTLLVISSMSSGNIFYKRITESRTANPWYYISDDDHETIEYLKKTSEPLDAVLSSYYLGNLIPAYSNNRVYLGHSLQTPDFSTRTTLAEQFYSCALSQEEAKEFIYSNNIKFVVFSKQDVDKTNIKTKNCEYPFLYEVFSTDSSSVYKN